MADQSRSNAGDISPGKGDQKPPLPAFLSLLVDKLDVFGRRLAALARDQIELDALTFINARNACALKSGDVQECILGAIFRLDEAIAFGGVKPFNFASGHDFSLHDKFAVRSPMQQTKIRPKHRITN